MNAYTAIILTILLFSADAFRAAESPTLQPLSIIPLDGVRGRIDHMAVGEKDQRLYVAALGNNTVEVIDVAAGKRVGTIDGLDEPQGVCVVPDSQQVVIASGHDGKCRFYDHALKLTAQTNNLDDADNVRYDAKAKQVVVGYGSGALAFIDPTKGTTVGDVKLDGHPESFQIEKQGHRIFVNVPSVVHVAVVDRDKRTVIAKWPLPGARANFPMALDEANRRVFIGCRDPAKLLVLDSDSGKTVSSLDCVGDTDDVFYDSAMKRIYVSGGKGTVSVFEQTDADHYRHVVEVPTGTGARTAFFSPHAHRLYVAVPHRDSQPAQIQVFSTSETSAPK